jgi:hypothetical protein
MKVRISTRAVYHKVAEVEIEIPDMNPNEVDEYLIGIDVINIYTDVIDDKLSEAEYEFGSGYDCCDGDWTDETSDSEWRYDIKGINYGGHL